MTGASRQRELWLDAMLSKYLPAWIESELGYRCRHLLGLGLRERSDTAIFAAARSADVILITKDADFLPIVARLGPPPRVILLNCGNCTNDELKHLLARSLGAAIAELEHGRAITEIVYTELPRR
ncbi:MAG: DUF5615 family PIN-like protein [Phycisphaeraceae bacterium]|nr:DUF5615 family PIN-like protein [Phycisphaeraceae bacterium]